jgi:ABC-type nitrate/sulfonate/bicarbonate transport system ATPase subunit
MQAAVSDVASTKGSATNTTRREAQGMAALIRVEKVIRSFIHDQQEVPILDGITLEVEQGSFVVIVGPSGCGKSTLLNIIAGLLPATAGNVYYKERLVVNPHLEMGYLTQKDTLMPWRSIERNIEIRSSASSRARRSSRRGTRRSASSTGRSSTTAPCGRSPSR